MEDTIKRRIVGAVVLVFFAILIVPVLLDGEGRIPEVANIEVPPMVKKPDTSELKVDLPVAARKTEPQAEEPVATLKVATPEPAESAKVAKNVAAQTQDFDDQGQLNAWSLQIASFKSTSNAAALRDKLRKQGFRAYNKESELSDGSILTQVLVGPESDYEKISVLKEQLAKSASDLGLNGPPLIVKYKP